MQNKKRDVEVKRISAALPSEVVDEMDAMVIANFTSRTSFLYNAIREKIEKERKLKEKDMLDSLETNI